MKIEVSNGEILDKYSILTIKANLIKDKNKLENIKKELESLTESVVGILDIPGIVDFYGELLSVNYKLWEIEDNIRDCERSKDFGERFIDLARLVYITNDRRAEIKKQINLVSGSELIEEKSYEKY